MFVEEHTEKKGHTPAWASQKGKQVQRGISLLKMTFSSDLWQACDDRIASILSGRGFHGTYTRW